MFCFSFCVLDAASLLKNMYVDQLNWFRWWLLSMNSKKACGYHYMVCFRHFNANFSVATLAIVCLSATANPLVYHIISRDAKVSWLFIYAILTISQIIINHHHVWNHPKLILKLYGDYIDLDHKIISRVPHSLWTNVSAMLTSELTQFSSWRWFWLMFLIISVLSRGWINCRHYEIHAENESNQNVFQI